MPTFEQFVKDLGEHAHRYGPEQLQQLHLDVQRFAQVVIAVYRAKEENRSGHSPQPRLDELDSDRILKNKNNENS